MVHKTFVFTSKSTIKLGDEILTLMEGAVLKEVRELLQKAIDKEMSQMFLFIASQMGAGNANFKVLQPYLPEPWKPYGKKYAAKKERLARHLRWFSYGFDSQEQPTGNTLQNEFQYTSPASILHAMGSTDVSISRDRSLITIRPAPHFRWQLNNMEFELEQSGLIDEEALRKLQNRDTKYRALVGPVFAYYQAVRIPRVVSKILKGL